MCGYLHSLLVVPESAFPVRVNEEILLEKSTFCELESQGNSTPTPPLPGFMLANTSLLWEEMMQHHAVLASCPLPPRVCHLGIMASPLPRVAASCTMSLSICRVGQRLPGMEISRDS